MASYSFVFFRDLCIGPSSYDENMIPPHIKAVLFLLTHRKGRNAINFGIKVVEEENKTFFFRSEGEERMEWMGGEGFYCCF